VARPESQPRYHAIIETDAFAADRLARLLSTLTWAIATPKAHDRSTGQTRASLEVPAHEYHRIARALGAAWRARGRHLNPAGAKDEILDAARALWRMALLAGGIFDKSGIGVCVSTPSGRMTLLSAARHLELEVGAPDGPAGTTIRIRANGMLSRLVRE
jgi:hypothetical protein